MCHSTLRYGNLILKWLVCRNFLSGMVGLGEVAVYFFGLGVWGLGMFNGFRG